MKEIIEFKEIVKATPEWLRGFLAGAISMRVSDLETAEGADHERAVRAIAAYEKDLLAVDPIGATVDKRA